MAGRKSQRAQRAKQPSERLGNRRKMETHAMQSGAPEALCEGRRLLDTDNWASSTFAGSEARNSASAR
eukprot:8507150-Alexandrium_andersonii.AAC.1